MSGRLRSMLPPWWVIAAALFPYLMVDAIYAIAVWQGFDEELLRMVDRRGTTYGDKRVALLIFSLCVWVVWRIARFHPLVRPGYFRWLNATPWRHPQPLPLGPVLPSWADALVVALVAGVIHLRHPGFDPLLAPVAWLLAWSLLASVLLALVEEGTYAVGVWFGAALVVWSLPLAVEPNGSALTALALSIPVGIIATYGVYRTFATFHDWHVLWLKDVRRLRLPHDTAEIQPEHLGWPVGQLHPEARWLCISFTHALILSLLIGWWCFWLPGDPEARQLLLGLCAFIGVVGRLGRYLDGYMPPISLLGRLGTLRLIIPSYDRVLVAPIIAALAALGIPLAFESAGWNERLGLSTATTATLLASLGLGPTLAKWRLTGRHRMAAGFSYLGTTHRG